MKEEVHRPNSILTSVRTYFDEAVRVRSEQSSAWVVDFCTLAVSFVLARCSFAFGTYPLALGWICALPSRGICAMAGGILGALTLGTAGLPYALVYVIAVVVRLVLGGGENADVSPSVFGEKLSVKLCVAILSGFILGIYEILLVGGAFSSVLYAAGCVVLPGIACTVYHGLFLFPDLSAKTFFVGGKTVFSGFRRRVNERRELICFQGAILLSLLSFGVALKTISFFGIDFSYLFAAFVVLFAGKRFGALRAMAAGFAVLVVIDPMDAVAYAIGGGIAALLFKIGVPYGLFGGGAALALWSFYSGGVNTLLSTFPEYAIGASLMLPILKNVHHEEVLPGDSSTVSEASDMVGTMALSMRGKNDDFLALEEAFSALSDVLSKSELSKKRPYPEALAEILSDTAKRLCERCEFRENCKRFSKNALKKTAEKVCRGISPTPEEFCECKVKNDATGAFLGVINRFFVDFMSENGGRGQTQNSAELCDVFSKMLTDVRLKAEKEFEVDKKASAALENVFLECGFPSGVVRVFGEREKFVLCATETADFEKFSSADVKNAFENALNLRLSTPEYYKKDSMILFRAHAIDKFSVICATASVSKREDEVCGDVCATFETPDGIFYAVLCDGMGTGALARKSAELCVSFLKKILTTGCKKTTALSLLNRLLRAGAEECSATVDIFEFDLKRGEGLFYKCGAAPSYLKRGGSIFRIRSGTVPIGVLKNVDAERIRVDVLPGDTVIVCSDGLSLSPEDSPWLIERLAKPIPEELGTFAKALLSEAKEMSGEKDDMTVMVLKIQEQNPQKPSKS